MATVKRIANLAGGGPGASRMARLSLVGLLPILLLLVIWQLVGSEDSVSFPPPTAWVTALGDMQDEGVLLPSIATTLKTYAVGLLLCLVLGVLFGMLIGGSAKLERASQPLMDFFRTLPPPAIVPVAALLLGVTLQMQVAIVVITCIWPILLNTATAMRTIPDVRLDMSRVLGLRWWERLFKVIVPSLAPGIMLGLRISVSIALLVALLVDILGAGEGVGRLIVLRQQTFDSAAVWGLLLIIGLLGYVLNAGLASFERRLFRNWSPAAQG